MKIPSLPHASPLLKLWRSLRPRRVAAAFDRGALPAYRLLVIKLALIAVLMAILGFDYDGRDLNMAVALQVLLILAAFWLRWRGSPRLATAMEAIALLLAASVAATFLTALLATTAFPYRDALLESADRAILPGFSWIDMVAMLRGHGGIVATMCSVYGTLLWQPFVLVAALAMTGRNPATWRFVRSWLLALTACVAIFPLVPAVGAHVFHHLSQSDTPGLSVAIAWRQVEILEALRNGSLHVLGSRSLAGIVSFPSFHAAGAVLLAWGYARLPVIGVPFVLLNIAMCLTAPLIGSHYFIDLAGGIAIALVAICASYSDATRVMTPDWRRRSSAPG